MKPSMEQRRTRRFELDLPLSITRASSVPITVSGRTRNISSTGVLFSTAAGGSDLSGAIEYIITLYHDGVQPVCLRCVGKVLRAYREAGSIGSSCEIAATLERYEFVRERAFNASKH
jgi:hypothetical protein